MKVDWDYKEYNTYKIIDVSQWNETYTKEGWIILHLLTEKYTYKSSCVQSHYAGGTSVPVVIDNSNDSHFYKFLIAQHKTYDVLYKKD